MRNPKVARYRIELVRETSIDLGSYVKISGPQGAARVCREIVAGADREMLMAVTLDTKNKVIGVNVVSIGTIDQSLAVPREVVKLALLQNAAAMIVAHNHPSGEPDPSREDAAFYERLKEAGKIIGIRILDSIILGDSEFYSMDSKTREVY
jgi:DNA repair protein RadC